MKAIVSLATVAAVLAAAACERPAEQIVGAFKRTTNSPADPQIGINVLLRAPATAAQLKELSSFGRVGGALPELNALFMRSRESSLPALRALPYVVAANPDAERDGPPIDAVAATDFSSGFGTWDLDAINVTPSPFAATRSVAYDGAGVYIGVLDSGLLDSWRQYFPEERIAQEYAVAFGGGGAWGTGATPERPNVWEHDQNSHGTHVTSTILGYQFGANVINGVAPLATIIPVKVLNQNGSGWSSVIAAGLVYVAKLKLGPLASHPVVINMSLGGSALDAVEQAAIDYAIAHGVIVVASAGNRGTNGMGYPGAYAPVISTAASGWIGEWQPAGNGSWWVNLDVAEPTNPDHFYIADFSSRQLPGQDLDVAAPGSWVVGPYQLQSGYTSYYFLGGTSMASPHVAGIVALMAQKNPALTASQAESILEASATPLPPGSRMIANPDGTTSEMSWDADATGAGLVTADAALAMTP